MMLIRSLFFILLLFIIFVAGINLSHHLPALHLDGLMHSVQNTIPWLGNDKHSPDDTNTNNSHSYNSEPSNTTTHNNNIAQASHAHYRPAPNTANIISSVDMNDTGLSQDLLDIKVINPQHIKIKWQLSNHTDKNIVLTPKLKTKLSLNDLVLVDTKYNKQLRVVYKNFRPLANCSFDKKYIHKYSQIQCTAIVGPVRFNSSTELSNNNNIKIYFPGIHARPVNVFLNLV